MFLWVILSCLVVSASGKSSRIVNGQTTTTVEHPHQAHLEADTLLGILWSAICGAAIIDNQWAVTAAHCTEGYSNFRIVVNKGQSSQATISVASVIEHPDYVGNYDPSYGAYPNDISLLRLSSNTVINTNNYIPLADSSYGDFTGSTCTITGWGLTSGDGSASSTLQQTTGEILDNAGCSALWNTPPEAPYHHNIHICIHEPTSGACNGDSGGPMVCGGVLAGITSWGASGCDTTVPSVYTRVSTYYSWIMSQTGLARSPRGAPIPVLY